MPETTAHRPTELPGWIRLEISRFSSEALNAVIGTWAARFRQIDFAGAVAAASQIVQQRPELATGYHLIMIAAGQAGDRPLERAMCEELLRVSMRRANVRMTQFYVAISEQLADASPEPTYRVTDEYTSCEWIEGGLTFGPNDVHACCIPNQGGKGGWVKLSPCTQEQAPSLVEILRARQELRHQAQSGGHAKCQGCSRLRKQDWSRPYLVDTLNFSHFQRCNLKCNYCYLEQPGFVPNETAWKQPHQLITHLRQLIDQKLLDPRAVVYWGGGEPTILDDFEDLLMALVRHGCSNVINTNGIKYSPAIEAALASRNTIVVCSIDAGSPEVYAAKKKADVLGKVLENNKRYAKAARTGRIFFKYIMDVDNCAPEEVLRFVEHTYHAGVKSVVQDVNSYNDFVTDEMIESMALMSRELAKLGIASFIGGCGVYGYPELAIHTRLQDALEASGTMTAEEVRRRVYGA